MLKRLAAAGVAAEERAGSVVASPSDAKGLAALVAAVRDAGSRVVHEWIPAEVAGAAAVALSYENAAGVREVAAPDLLAVVEPGTTSAELEDALVAAGLYWPVADFTEPTGRIGDIVAGAPGAWTLTGNIIRRHVLALEAVLADGTQLRVGSRTVKCVTGYDLKQIFTGSAGTLGLISGLTLRLEAIANREAVQARYERDFDGLDAGPVCLAGAGCRACSAAGAAAVTSGEPRDGSIDILERLKREFDPDGVLAPVAAVVSGAGGGGGR